MYSEHGNRLPVLPPLAHNPVSQSASSYLVGMNNPSSLEVDVTAGLGCSQDDITYSSVGSYERTPRAHSDGGGGRYVSTKYRSFDFYGIQSVDCIAKNGERRANMADVIKL